MYDGITINYQIQDFTQWKQTVNISLGVNVDITTAEIYTIKRKHTITTYHKSKWETYDLIITEVFYIGTGKTANYLTIKGSLHKNHFGGKNYQQFTHQQVIEQITYLCKNLCINPLKAKIWSLEIGVNIITPFMVTPFLRQNIVCYKTHPFNRYTKDRKGICLGNKLELTQYVVKVYDKGIQNDLPQNLMRVEKRCFKMQLLKNVGIIYLSDLLDKEKSFQLLPMLIEMWDNVLIYDIESAELKIKSRFKTAEIDLLIKGQDHKYWERLIKENRHNHNYQRKKFIKLVNKYGNKRQQSVKELIKKEWQELFKSYTNLPIGKTQIAIPNHVKLSTSKNDNLHILTIKVKSKNVEKRFCQWCNKDISHQKKDSKYCRDILVGKVLTHDCRNDFNNQIYRIKKITDKGVLFDITPFIVPRKKIN